MKKEIRFSGFGGQGVILMGHIFGEGAVLDGKDVTLTKSYGPEARGGACSTDIIISDDRVRYPQVRDPDILISMSQSALETYVSELKDDGMLLIDTGLVESSRDAEGLSATNIAEEELGLKMVANIVMLGYFTARTELVSKDSMEEAVAELVPEGTEKKNLEAFNRGYEEVKK
ncbi:MAG: 2-oxoacid:acceptor oxidoreductase family protein [Candidatus Thermoplasmatota archaeon]